MKKVFSDRILNIKQRKIRMVFSQTRLNASVSCQFSDSLNAHFQETKPELILVSALTREFGLTACRRYLEKSFEQLKAQGRDVLIMERNQEFPHPGAGQLVLMEEIRCEEDVTKALAIFNAGAKVIATIHGADDATSIERLHKLAKRPVQEHVVVVNYQASHEFVAY